MDKFWGFVRTYEADIKAFFGAIIYLRRKGYLRLTSLKISTFLSGLKFRFQAPKPRFERDGSLTLCYLQTRQLRHKNPQISYIQTEFG